MSVRQVLVYPDPRLKRPSAPVGRIDDEVRALCADLADTLAAAPGVGIAAPQIAVHRRVVLVDMGRASRVPEGTNHGRLFLVDPVIVRGEGSRRGREGCLSLPEVVADVTRQKALTVRGLDPEGQERTWDLEGFEATAVQHELDHLDGVLFVDRVTSLHRGLLRRGAVGPKGSAAAAEAVVELLAGHLPQGRALVREALRIAARIHEGQVRDEGTPYLDHPIRVARTLVRDLGVADPEVLAAAVLHVTLDDAAANGHDLAEGDLARELSPRVASLVRLLTKEPADAAGKAARDDAYFARLAEGPREAVLVKLADRLDNVRSLLACPSPEKRSAYARETHDRFLPLARRAGALAAELSSALLAVIAADGLPPAEFPDLARS